jgi:hypothetical protein
MLKVLQFIIFIFILLISIDTSAQQVSDTSKILIRFNEPMSHDGIFDLQNYSIYRDENTPIAIYKVGVVHGDTAVVLYTERYYPEAVYKIIINNLKDKSGNIISQDHKTALY